MQPSQVRCQPCIGKSIGSSPTPCLSDERFLVPMSFSLQGAPRRPQRAVQ